MRFVCEKRFISDPEDGLFSLSAQLHRAVVQQVLENRVSSGQKGCATKVHQIGSIAPSGSNLQLILKNTSLRTLVYINKIIHGLVLVGTALDSGSPVMQNFPCSK